MVILHKDSAFIPERSTCVALGNFDGLHVGHETIVRACVKTASESGRLSCVYTFEKNTSYSLGQGKDLLTTNTEKEAVLSSLGCDVVLFDDFEKVKGLSCAEFCKDILSERLRASTVFCGENFRFGKGGAGDCERLKNELEPYGIRVNVSPYACVDGIVVSSTRIREAIRDGNMALANRMLGRPYSYTGIVLHGKKLGRLLDSPTVNIAVPEGKVIPAGGVYFSYCRIGGERYPSLSNIGVRPTVESRPVAINCETYLFGFDREAYGETVTVEFLERLRPEKRFSDLQDLKKQLLLDKQAACRYFHINEA